MEDGQPGNIITPTNANNGSWQFNAEDRHDEPTDEQPLEAPESAAQTDGLVQPVSWTASEYIAHQKSLGWYMLLAVVTVVVAAATYLLIRDIITVGMIVVVAIFFGVLAARKPRVLEYGVSEQGVSIGRKLYPYELFKSFSVVQEAAVESIMLTPLRRFMPPITVYFAPDDGPKIVDVLGNYLPHEDHDPDMIDNLMHKLRF